MKEKDKEVWLSAAIICFTLATSIALVSGLVIAAKEINEGYTIKVEIINKSLAALEKLENCNLLEEVNNENKLNYLELTKEQRKEFYIEFCNNKRPKDIAKSYDDLGNIGSFWCKYHSGYTKHYSKMLVEEFIKNQTEVKNEI